MKQKSFYKHKIENLITIGRIVTVHMLQYKKDYSFAGERHNFWEMVCVEENEVVCSTDGKSEFPLRAGELLFHSPNEFHTIRANGKTGAKVNIVSFECKSEAIRFFCGKKIRLPDAYAPYLDGIFREAERTFLLPEFDPSLTRLTLRNDAALGGQQMLRTYLEQLLILLMRNETENGNSHETFVKREESEHLAKAVTEFLRNNLYTSFTLEDLCRHFHYSRTYLCTRFKEATRHTIFNEYTRLKIAEARKLLNHTTQTIAEISALLSFDSPAYFSSTFKKYTGVSPREYRKYSKKNF